MHNSLSKTLCSQSNFHWRSSRKTFGGKYLLSIFLQIWTGDKWKIHILVKLRGEICYTVYFNKIKILMGNHFFRYFKKNLGTRLTLFRMGFFGAVHGWSGAFLPPIPKICHTYPTMIKRGTVIPYLRKIQKIYKSCHTSLEFCWHQHFFTGNQQILLRQEIQI